MKVRKINKHSSTHKRLSGVPGISIEPKKGVFTLNKMATHTTGLQDSDYVELWQDEDSPGDWYLVKTTRKTGLKVRTYKNGTVMFNSVVAARSIVSERSSMLLSKESVQIEGCQAWPVITSSAVGRAGDLADRVKQFGS